MRDTRARSVEVLKMTLNQLAELDAHTLEDPPRSEEFLNSLPAVENQRLDIAQLLSIDAPEMRSRIFQLWAYKNTRGNGDIFREVVVQDPNTVVSGGAMNYLVFLAQVDSLERAGITKFLEDIRDEKITVAGDSGAKAIVAGSKMVMLEE